MYRKNEGGQAAGKNLGEGNVAVDSGQSGAMCPGPCVR